MNQCDSVLKMYAEAGMRTVEDWTAAGRDIVVGSKSRASAPHRGAQVELYTRDQTQIRHKKMITKRCSLDIQG
jgi:hypothetical protein